MTTAHHQAKEHIQEDEDNFQDSDDEDQDQTRAACHSKSTGEVKPDVISYYKGTPWWAILMKAKIKYRHHIALNHGFPDHDLHLGDAREVLLEAINKFKIDNEILDQGTVFFSLYILIFTYQLVQITNQYARWIVWYVQHCL